MNKKLGFLDRKSNKKAMLISLMVAFILLLVEVIRWVIELVVNAGLKAMGYCSETFAYGFGLIVAVLILLLFISRFWEVLEE